MGDDSSTNSDSSYGWKNVPKSTNERFHLLNTSADLSKINVGVPVQHHSDSSDSILENILASSKSKKRKASKQQKIKRKIDKNTSWDSSEEEIHYKEKSKKSMATYGLIQDADEQIKSESDGDKDISINAAENNNIGIQAVRKLSDRKHRKGNPSVNTSTNHKVSESEDSDHHYNFQKNNSLNVTYRHHSNETADQTDDNMSDGIETNLEQKNTSKDILKNSGGISGSTDELDELDEIVPLKGRKTSGFTGNTSQSPKKYVNTKKHNKSLDSQSSLPTMEKKYEAEELISKNVEQNDSTSNVSEYSSREEKSNLENKVVSSNSRTSTSKYQSRNNKSHSISEDSENESPKKKNKSIAKVNEIHGSKSFNSSNSINMDSDFESSELKISDTRNKENNKTLSMSKKKLTDIYNKQQKKIQDFLEINQSLKEKQVKKFSNIEITSDDEIWIVQCPKTVNTNVLEDQCIFDAKFQNNKQYSSTKFNDANDRNISMLFQSEQGLNVMSVVLTGHVIIQENCCKTNDIKLNIPDKNQVPFPTNLITRHPLLGANFKEKVYLKDEIQKKFHKNEKVKTKKRRSILNKNIVDKEDSDEGKPNMVLSKKAEKHKRKRLDTSDGPSPKKTKSKHSNQSWTNEDAIERNLFC